MIRWVTHTIFIGQPIGTNWNLPACCYTDNNQPPAGRTPTYQLLTSVQLFQDFEMDSFPSIFNLLWKGEKGAD